ncbi:HigA family addiction module antidote protein [Limosilactobacillus gastricus]|uniref:HTH cro/C1-type domain-containing protein n=1 Tax=Limosilactobacillus gastricus DSM 16045 TaxID=1423749 RepID=A0A0R1VCL1_9LACO|nr:HigA family addiction module antitoxin [Limosilactobacillus gastricus]KRM03264.1 hypothetical protein FC60_GL001348 [Limosilactobacillus gastricus DSM 16045]QGF40140.1 HigA family addiction module antidote protein [Limosilactobacillus gastricus]
MTRIPTPQFSEVLKEEFMEPYGLSAYRLAKEINVPVSRIQDLLHDRRQVSLDTSIRLGRFFGMSDRYFLNVQLNLELRQIKNEKADEYQKIKPIQSVN